MDNVRALEYIEKERATLLPGMRNPAPLVSRIPPPSMKPPEKRSFAPWVLTFTALFALSLDFWWWDEPPGKAFLNVPFRLYYFMGLSLLFAAVMYAFTRRFWIEDDDEGTRSEATPGP